MKIIILLLFIGRSDCFEFSERPRNFSIELIHHSQLETNGHFVLSPFGVWTLLTEATLGASGDSYKQLRGALRLPKNNNKIIKGYRNLTQLVLDPTTAGVTLTSTNFMFLDTNASIDPNYMKTMQLDFGATIRVLDFGDPILSTYIANNYIQNSGGRISIRLIFDDFTKSKMILSNVISFSALWSSPFSKRLTSVEPFYNENKRLAGQVNMMYKRGLFPFSNIKPLKAFVLELPYGRDEKYSMLIMLPYQNVKIAEMYMNFAEVTLTDVTKKLQDDINTHGLKEIDIRIPRFKISTTLVLDKPLNNIGIYDIFEPLYSDFGNITKDTLFTLAVVHKADIEVTESGTVASDAMPAILSDRITPAPGFLANRPFVYFVIEKSTTTIILGGIYSKPTVY